MIRLRQPLCGARRVVLACCAMIGMAAPAAVQSAPPPSREELLRQWDLDRDGKIDAGETEIARARMRRTRHEALMNSGTDPVTGRPRTRAMIDPVTGRPLAPGAASNEPPDRRGGLSAPVDDGGLILVPGTGEPVDGIAGAAISPTPPARVTQPDRPALPGTRVPATTAAVPSVAPRIPAGGQSYSGAGDLRPRAASPNLPLNPQPGRPPVAGERPGIISGGVRAGGAAARPGYGAGEPPSDLNAGRLPGGLPQTRGQIRGVAPGTSVVPRGGALPPGAGRLTGPGQAPSRSGMGPSTGRLAPAVPSTGVPSAGVPLAPRPMLRQPAAARLPAQAPNTVPRVPRVSPDDFYGR